MSLLAKGFNKYLDLVDSSDNIDRESEGNTRYSRRDQLNKTITYNLIRGFLLLIVEDNNVLLSNALVKKITWLSKSLILLK